jgi:hypothetical protein
MPERRIIRSEPLLIAALRRREPIIPRGVYREAVLDILEDVCRGLRDRGRWSDAFVGVIQTTILRAALSRFGEALGIEALRKV